MRALIKRLLPFNLSGKPALTIIAVSSSSNVDSSVQVRCIPFDRGILARWSVSSDLLPLGTHIHGATEVCCRKRPGMDHAETRTNPRHLHLDQSGSSQARESQGAACGLHFKTKSEEAQELDTELMTKYSEVIYFSFM